MLLWTIRGIYIVILAGIAARITSEFSGIFVHGSFDSLLLFLGILGGGSIAVVIDVLARHKKISTFTAIYFGLLVGSLLGHLLSLALGPTLSLWSSGRFSLSVPFSLVTTTVLCYICTSVLLQTKNDFRFIIPYVEFSRQLKGRKPLIVDSSVIIDGRIADIADTGLLDQTVVIPRFVLGELQSIADSSDKLRRNRGRRGLTIVDRLRKCSHVDVEMHEEGAEDAKSQDDIDTRLIQLAKSLDGKLVTNDVSLSKLAKIQNVATVNLNEVSGAARPPVLWGETLVVKLVKEGEEPGQGIGYLDDGTMVVAEMGRGHVGSEVSLVVTSVLQTSAGRMVFGRIDAKSVGPSRLSGARQ